MRFGIHAVVLEAGNTPRLVERAGAAPSGNTGSENIHVDWSAVGRNSARLGHVACGVLGDKRGLDELEGRPVYSLLQVIRVGD